MIVPKFVSCYGFLEHFIPQASGLISINYVTGTAKATKAFYLQLNIN